jgi:hypothetical protein
MSRHDIKYRFDKRQWDCLYTNYIMLPLSEDLQTAILLAISIARTRQRPLLKTLVITYLCGPVEGPSEEELALKALESLENIEAMKKGL